jgi:hypothetical protein
VCGHIILERELGRACVYALKPLFYDDDDQLIIFPFGYSPRWAGRRDIRDTKRRKEREFHRSVDCHFCAIFYSRLERLDFIDELLWR